MIDGKNIRQNLEKILDKNEQGYIEQFYNNEPMREAVKKVLLTALYENGTIKGNELDPLRNVAFSIVAGSDKLSDEEAGRTLKILWEGVNSLEVAFNAMSVFKIDEPKGEEINNAK